jgi:hypothetical protein
VRAKADPADRRRQILALTPKGEALCRKLQPIWRAVARATEALLAEAAPEFLDQFSRVEMALERDPMNARAAKLLRAPKRKISGEKHAKAPRR